MALFTTAFEEENRRSYEGSMGKVSEVMKGLLTLSNQLHLIMMDLTDHNQRLVDLAEKWRTGWITEAEYQELDSWYLSLEDIPLGPPVELTVDRLEKRLHEQLYKNLKSSERDDDFNATQLFGK